MVRPDQKREAARAMVDKGLPKKKACQLVSLSRSAYYAIPTGPDLAAVETIKDLARNNQKLGYRMLHAMHRNDGGSMNHKKFYRIYTQLNLGLKRRRRKKVIRERVPLELPEKPGLKWSMDFVFDRTEDARPLKVLTIVDDCSKECIWLEVARGIGGSELCQILEFLFLVNGMPESIRTDNGPEFTSRSFCLWLMKKGVKHDFIQPGKPTQNAYIESFNGRFREECLNGNFFLDLDDAQVKIESWRTFYNEVRAKYGCAFSETLRSKPEENP